MMKWGHLPVQAAGRAQLRDGAVGVWRERGRDARLAVVVMEV